MHRVHRDLGKQKLSHAKFHRSRMNKMIGPVIPVMDKMLLLNESQHQIAYGKSTNLAHVIEDK